MHILKAIARRYIQKHPTIGIIQQAQRQAIEALFDGMCLWLNHKPKVDELPSPLSDYLEYAGLRDAPEVSLALINDPSECDEDKIIALRAIADYICSLTDFECEARSRWVRGIEVPSISRL